MRIKIKEIGDTGFRFSRRSGAAGVEKLLGDLEMADGERSAAISVELTLMGDTVFVQGELSGEFWVPCSRCLSPAPIVMSESGLKLTFFPRSAVPGADVAEVELDPDDLDTYGHDGDEIDLGELLREHLMLAVPISPLCDSECTGLDALRVDRDAAKDVDTGLSGWQQQIRSLKDRMEN